MGFHLHGILFAQSMHYCDISRPTPEIFKNSDNYKWAELRFFFVSAWPWSNRRLCLCLREKPKIHCHLPPRRRVKVLLRFSGASALWTSSSVTWVARIIVVTQGGTTLFLGGVFLKASTDVWWWVEHTGSSFLKRNDAQKFRKTMHLYYDPCPNYFSIACSESSSLGAAALKNYYCSRWHGPGTLLHWSCHQQVVGSSTPPLLQALLKTSYWSNYWWYLKYMCYIRHNRTHYKKKGFLQAVAILSLVVVASSDTNLSQSGPWKIPSFGRVVLVLLVWRLAEW